MKLAILSFAVTFALHFAWEMLQAPVFMEFAETLWAGTVRCFVAALGDVLIAIGAYVVAALAFRRAAWPILDGWRAPAAAWIVAGMLATIVFERWALARGRWVYGPEMPLVAGIGLLPLLQWLVVPVLTLMAVRWFAPRT